MQTLSHKESKKAVPSSFPMAMSTHPELQLNLTERIGQGGADHVFIDNVDGEPEVHYPVKLALRIISCEGMWIFLF